MAHAATVVDRSSGPFAVQPEPPQQRVVVVQREAPAPKQGGSVLFTAFVLLVAGGIVTVFWLLANETKPIRIPRWESGSASASSSAWSASSGSSAPESSSKPKK